jgi:hypothetical protein
LTFSLREYPRHHRDDFIDGCGRKKLYKAKIKEWGLSKYLPSLKADWMLKKAEKRKREEGKDTDFLMGDKPLTIGRIQNSAKRAKQPAGSVLNSEQF